MTSELRPAVEVFRDANIAFNKTWENTKGSAERVGPSNQAAATIIEQDREAVRAEQAAEIERLRGALARMGRDKETLLTFARAIQTWRSDADGYDEECDHPQRDYCEDVELMEKAAGYALRRIAERAARGEQ